VPRGRSPVVVLVVALALAAGAFATKPGTARAHVVAAVAGDIPQRPPVVNLRSRSPWQRGVWGTFCVFVPDEDGGGVSLCADAADDPEPRWLSVVRPGERIAIFLRKAATASGAAFVYPRGCEDRPARRSFEIAGRRTTWVVPPRSGPKRVELSLWFRFTTVDGRVGDTDAALGILVSRTRARGLVPNRNSLDCGEPF
jgi:hypothetical protein